MTVADGALGVTILAASGDSGFSDGRSRLNADHTRRRYRDIAEFQEPPRLTGPPWPSDSGRPWQSNRPATRLAEAGSGYFH